MYNSSNDPLHHLRALLKFSMDVLMPLFGEVFVLMDIKEGEVRFYIGDNEKDPLAEIIFRYKNSNIIVIERTFVSEELRGQNIAGQLLKKVAAKAREDGLKIIPECTYAQKVMNRGEEYKDVLYN